MKANEAPEKLYIGGREHWMKSWTAFTTKAKKGDDIEYIRTDAFIEKAWSWIEDNMLSSNQQDKSRFYYEQFKNYMKGE